MDSASMLLLVLASGFERIYVPVAPDTRYTFSKSLFLTARTASSTEKVLNVSVTKAILFLFVFVMTKDIFMYLEVYLLYYCRQLFTSKSSSLRLELFGLSFSL